MNTERVMQRKVPMSEDVVKRSVVVNVPIEHAFKVFTERFDLWWPREHHVGKADLQTAIIEPKAGGRFYEKGVDGSECEWGAVLEFAPPSRVVLAWHLDPSWTYLEKSPAGRSLRDPPRISRRERACRGASTPSLALCGLVLTSDLGVRGVEDEAVSRFVARGGRAVQRELRIVAHLHPPAIHRKVACSWLSHGERYPTATALDAAKPESTISPQRDIRHRSHESLARF